MAGLKLKSGGSGLESLSLPGKLAVGVILALMVGAAYFVVFYGDVESNISSQQQLLEAKKNELVQAKEADKAYNKDLTELERRKQLARKQKKILPDDSETPAFLSTLQTVATISGVKLASWSPQDELTETFYAKVPMELKLSGKFHQVAKFFHQIGQVDRIINMENIVIKVDLKDAAEKAKAQAESSSGVAEETVNVEVQCLATAFRSLRSGEGGGDKKKRRGGAK